MSTPRKVFNIPGGVHPAQNKQQSLRTVIKTASIPNQLIFPLAQHIGAPAEVIVDIGQHVLKGEMIAKPNGFVSVPIHSSTSGTIIAIENRPIAHSSGMSAPCVILESDGKDQWIAHKGFDDYQTIEKPELIDCIRNAGIAGMGGAGFPSAVKLSTRPDQVIETLIINGTECEPYITADDILMRERAEQIIKGVEILAHLIKPTVEVLIGVEDNKPEGIAALKTEANKSSINIDVVSFPTKYPSGGEKQLIQILTGKEIPQGGLPSEIGVICQNIGTTVAIYKAVCLGEPLISRITTITGNAVAKQQNYEVLLGSSMRHLLEASGYQENNAARLIMGGPMMGFTLQSQDLPIVKTTNCILAPTEQELSTPPPQQACIRCGMCSEACPVNLLPQQMYWFSRAKNHEGLKAHNLFDCIECGACSFVCPSSIPLVQYYRASKSDIRHTEIEAKKASHSKERFEARQARLERTEIEKEARRKERQEKATAAAAKKANAEKLAAETSSTESIPIESTNASVDPVQAAIERAKAKSQSNTDPIEAKAALPTEKTNKKSVDAISDDPVQAAIQRAQTKRLGTKLNESTDDKKAKLEKDIANFTRRIKTSEEKLVTAEAEGANTVEAFKAGIAKTQEKLSKAKIEFNALTSTAALTKNTETKKTTATIDDPIQAAIERAKTKRADASNIDPRTQAENNIVSLNKRIDKAIKKLAAAEAGDIKEILQDSLKKLQDKLHAAEKALEDIA